MATEKKAVFPPNVKPAAPYSPGILAGDVLYVSGQTSRDPQGQLAATTEEHVRQSLRNVQNVVEAAGMTMADIRAAQVYLLRPEQRPALEKVWREAFSNGDLRYELIESPRLPTDMPVEINAIAVRGSATLPQAGTVTVTANSRTDETAAEAAKRLIPELGQKLAANSLKLEDVVAVRVTMRDLDEFQSMNEAYGAAFGTHRPSRTTVQAKHDETLRITMIAVP